MQTTTVVGMERARERLRDATSVFAAAEATYWEQRQGNGEIEGNFSQYMEQLQDKKHALTGEVLKYLGLQWVAPSSIPPGPSGSGESVDSSPQTNGLHAPPHGAGVLLPEQVRPNVKPDVAWPPGEELQMTKSRSSYEDQAAAAQRGNRCNLPLEDSHQPAPFDGSTDWDHRETVGNLAPSTPTPGIGCQDALTVGRVRGDDPTLSWKQPAKPLHPLHRQDLPTEIMTPPWVVPPKVEDAGNSDGTGGGGLREPRPPSPISTLPAVLVESGPPAVVTGFTHSADGSSAAQALHDKMPCNTLRLVPSFVSEDVSSRHVASTSLGRESSFSAVASPGGSPSFDSDQAMNQPRGWGGGHIGDDVGLNAAADRVVVLRDELASTSRGATVRVKRSWGIDGGPSEGVDSGGGGGGRSSVRRHDAAAVAATTAGGLTSSPKLQRLDSRSKQTGAVRALKGSQACRDAGCHRRPIYAFKGDTKALCCPIHRSKEMVNVRHPLCRHESCFRQPSFGIEGDQRASFCSEHKLPEMINVSSRRCQAAGCLRHPNFGFQGDRRATYCCRHKAPGMIDVVSRRCQHPQCVRRPLYAMTGQRAMFCRTHKDAGMTDVVSRRCNFEEGCDRHPSFGWKQGDGKARRCAHHRLEGMESVKVNRRGALKRAGGK